MSSTSHRHHDHTFQLFSQFTFKGSICYYFASVKTPYLQMILPVVWNASSTMPSSWSAAARWNTLKMFFQPDLMFPACEFTICATHRTTMSLIVGDLKQHTSIWNLSLRLPLLRNTFTPKRALHIVTHCVMRLSFYGTLFSPVSQNRLTAFRT